MIATVKENVGALGVPVYTAGTVVEVHPFVGPYGDVCPGLFQDSRGLVWPAHLLIVPENANECP